MVIDQVMMDSLPQLLVGFSDWSTMPILYGPYNKSALDAAPITIFFPWRRCEPYSVRAYLFYGNGLFGNWSLKFHRVAWKPFWVYSPNIVYILCNPISSFLVRREQKVFVEKPMTKHRKKSDFLTLRTLQTAYIWHVLDIWNKIFFSVAFRWLCLSFAQLDRSNSGPRTWGNKNVPIRKCIKCFQKLKSHIDLGH